MQCVPPLQYETAEQIRSCARVGADSAVTARSKVEQPIAGGLSDAVSFVRQVGGLDQAKSLLQTIEEIKNL